MTAAIGPMPVKQQLEIISALVRRTRVFYDIWWASAGKEGRETYRYFWEQTGAFWGYIEHALLFSYILHMASLYERRKDTINLVQLQAWYRSQASKSEQHARMEELFNISSTTVKGLTIIRSNVMAHRSASLSYNDAFKLAQIRPVDMRILTDTTLEIINLMRDVAQIGSITFDDFAASDLTAFLDEAIRHDDVEITDSH